MSKSTILNQVKMAKGCIEALLHAEIIEVENNVLLIQPSKSYPIKKRPYCMSTDFTITGLSLQDINSYLNSCPKLLKKAVTETIDEIFNYTGYESRNTEATICNLQKHKQLLRSIKKDYHTYADNNQFAAA